MFASSEGHLEVVKVLLNAKADPLLKDKDNDDAITFAKRNGHGEVAEYLMSVIKAN
jgi:ankyrin repeat protein